MFKSCSCGYAWKERPEFLGDARIEMLGYQVDFDHLELGLLLFNHMSCGTTLGVPVADLKDLYDGPVFKRNLHGTEDCPSYCLYQNNLDVCPQECECAYVRQIMQVIKRWPKE